MLKILGVGLPRTGTNSMCEALRILGYNAIHHAPERIPLDINLGRDFAVYNDVDAVLDAPACYFQRELTQVYQPLKYILTVRDDKDWWESIRAHSVRILEQGDEQHVAYTKRLHAMLFGCEIPHRWLYLRAYRRHNQQMWELLPKPQTLTIDVTREGWEPLCRFLGREVPDAPFPWNNRLVS